MLSQSAMRAIRYNPAQTVAYYEENGGKSQSAMRAIRYNHGKYVSLSSANGSMSQSAMRAIRYNQGAAFVPLSEIESRNPLCVQ